MHCILVLRQLILSSHRKLNWRYMILTLNFIAVDLIECRSASKIDSVSNSPRNYILLLTIMLREILRKPFRCGCGHLVLEYIFKCFSKKSVPSCWPLLLKLPKLKRAYISWCQFSVIYRLQWCWKVHGETFQPNLPLLNIEAAPNQF